MFVVKNATIHVGNGTVLENSDMLVDQGKIVQIGQSLDADCVVDASGKHVFPGFIDCCTIWGILTDCFEDAEGEEKTDPVTPQMNAKYAFHADNVNYQELCEYGITTLGVAPQNHNVFGGMIAAFKAHGNGSAPILVKEQVAMKGSVDNNVKRTYGPKSVTPTTKMAIFALLKDTLRKTQAYKPEKGYDEKYEAILKVLAKEMPLFMAANSTTEIHNLLESLKGFDVELTIVNAYDAAKCVDELKENNVAVVLGNQTTTTEAYYKIPKADLKKLYDAQIPMALTSSNDSMMDCGRETLLWNTTYLKKAKIPSEDILKTITSTPAKLLHIDDVCGTLEAGKDADFSIWTNNPIDTFQARCTNCYIQGVSVFEKEEASCH